MIKPTFSIITPLFQASAYLGGLINSLQEQSCPDWELLLVPDDGKDYGDIPTRDPRIRLVVRDAQGTGVGPTRNAGCAAAHGAYLVLLDQDDCLQSDYLSVFRDYFKRTGAAAAICPTEVVNAASGELLYHAGNSLVGGTLNVEDFGWLLASVRVVVKADEDISTASCYAEDVVRDALLINRLGPLPVLPTNYRLSSHAQQTTRAWNEETIRAAYTRLQAEFANTAPEVAKVFEIRHAANLIFSRFSTTKDWYAFWGAVAQLPKS